MSNIKVPCPSCVLRGPVWLNVNRKCAYCGRTWANPDVSIWSMVPLEWWLEEGMMAKIKLPLKQAQGLTDKIIAALEPGCLKIEAAGSIRRCRPEVGDVEIVCIPKQSVDLFGDPIGSVLDMVLANLVEEGRLIRGDKNGVKYKTFFIPTVPDLKLDLFITTPECWGVNFTIRTGPAEFSQRLVTQRDKGGLLPSDLNISGARVWRGADALATEEERQFFELVGGPGWWIEPKDRN